MKHVVLSIALLAATVAVAQESQDDLSESKGGLHGIVGATWDSQYIWRGFNVFGNDVVRGNSAAHALVDLNLFDTGFGVSAVGHQSLSNAFGELQRWDGTVYYQNGLFGGETFATNFRLGYVYYYYPKPNYGMTQDLMEGHAVLSWPNLLPIKGLQPSYAFAYMLPGMKNHWAEFVNADFGDNSTGMFHIAMLDYAFTVPALLASMDDQAIKLHSEVVYNSGVSPFGNEVKSGFSDAVVGASTDFAFGANRNIILTPFVYYQFSVEETVNPDNELWGGISLKYAF
jgi:hypothetical protein